MNIKKFVTALSTISILMVGLNVPQVANADPVTGLSPSPAELTVLPLTLGSSNGGGSDSVSTVMMDFDILGGTGDQSDYACSVSGSLPTGMTLDSSADCIIEGITTAVGTFNFTVAVTESGTPVASVDYSVVVEAYSLQNAKLRFGSGDNHSIAPYGGIQQPFYFGVATDAHPEPWFPLIFSDPNGYSTDAAFGIGTGSSNWNGNDRIFDLTDGLSELNASISSVDDLTVTGWTVDKSGFTVVSSETGVFRGYGALTSATRFKAVSDGSEFILHNTYELGQDANFIKTTSSLENLTSSGWDNINFWIGTRDDYVGGTDRPQNTKGNFVDGTFVAIESQAEVATVVMTTSNSDGTFFYSTNPEANTIIDDCCSFEAIFSVDPTLSPIYDVDPVVDPAGYNGYGEWLDSAYGFVANLGALAAGSRSANTVWYFGGGATGDLGNISASIVQAADPSPTSNIREVPYYGPVNLVVDPRGLANGTASATGSNLDTVTAVSVNGVPTTFRLNSDGTITFDIPDLAPGRHQVVFFVQVNNVSLVSTIEITGRTAPAQTEEKVLNAGTFDRYVAVYAKGYAGSTLTWKIAGKWFKTELTENYEVFQRPTIYRNFAINVELYIDGERLFQKNVLTK